MAPLLLLTRTGAAVQPPYEFRPPDASRGFEAGCPLDYCLNHISCGRAPPGLCSPRIRRPLRRQPSWRTDVIAGRGGTAGRIQFALALAALLLCALAASARADIVYDGGASITATPYKILVAHDDGSSPQTIVTTYADPDAVQSPGVDETLAPA